MCPKKGNNSHAKQTDDSRWMEVRAGVKQWRKARHREYGRYKNCMTPHVQRFQMNRGFILFWFQMGWTYNFVLSW